MAHEASALAQFCQLSAGLGPEQLAPPALRQLQQRSTQQPGGGAQQPAAEHQQSPFFAAAQLERPLSRSSWPMAHLQHGQAAPGGGHAPLEQPPQLAMSSSWCNSSMSICSSQLSSSGMLQLSWPGDAHAAALQLQLQDAQQQQDERQQQVQQRQQVLLRQQVLERDGLPQHPQLSVNVHASPLRSGSACSSCSPCSHMSDLREFSSSLYESSSGGSSLMCIAHSSANSSLGSAPRASSSSSTASSARGGAGSLSRLGLDAGDDGGAAADAAAGPAPRCWGGRTRHVASRPAPGGALGDGIAWIMPEFGGREVLADYEFGQTLGCGTFGVTRLVAHRKTARPWACKTICKASIAASPAAQSDVQHEVAILQHLRGHSGIVQLQGVYEDERNIHLVMELCTGGDLLDYISRFGRLSEDEAADIAAVMLSTLGHCHRLGVVHRDIKPENFLLGAPTLLSAPAGSAARALRVSDFGVSVFYQPGERFGEIVGTPYYMAPEVLERCYGPEADVWSAGVVIYLMLAGCLPFNGGTDRQIIKAVLDSEPDFAGPAWAGVSAAARACVARMLVKAPAGRATIEQLLQDPWLAGRCGGAAAASADAAAPSGRADSADSVATRCCPRCSASGDGGCCSPAGGAPSGSGSAGTSPRSKGVSWASPCVIALDAPTAGRSGSPPPRQAAPSKPACA